jgi:hypothetical protein
MSNPRIIETRRIEPSNKNSPIDLKIDASGRLGPILHIATHIATLQFSQTTWRELLPFVESFAHHGTLEQPPPAAPAAVDLDAIMGSDEVHHAIKEIQLTYDLEKIRRICEDLHHGKGSLSRWPFPLDEDAFNLIWDAAWARLEKLETERIRAEAERGRLGAGGDA